MHYTYDSDDTSNHEKSPEKNINNHKSGAKQSLLGIISGIISLIALLIGTSLLMNILQNHYYWTLYTTRILLIFTSVTLFSFILGLSYWKGFFVLKKLLTIICVSILVLIFIFIMVVYFTGV